MTTTETQLLAGGARELEIDLGPEVVARIDRFLGVLRIWNRRVRLTGEGDVGAIIEKHVIDSLAPVPWLPSKGLVIDVGSGAGFPGIVLACARPDLDYVLLEPRRRRTSFLREVIRTVPLPTVRTLETRAEDAARDPQLVERAAVVIGRAIRFDAYLPMAAPFLGTGGKVIAMQTPRVAETAGGTAARVGLRVLRRRDYTLSGDTARSLLLLGRDETVP